MVEHKEEAPRTPAQRSKKDDPEESKIDIAGLHVDVEGHVVDPAYAPYSGQNAGLDRAQEEKAADNEAVKLMAESREDARAENEADNVKALSDAEKAKEEEAKAREEEEKRRQEEAEEAVKNWEEGKGADPVPVKLEAVDGVAPPGEDYEPEMPVLTEPEPKSKAAPAKAKSA